MPFDWAAAAEHCRAAWLRGRFLARGSLSLAGGRTHLEFVVDPAEAPDLAARLADIGLPVVVADPARPGRGDLEERRGGRDVPAPDRGDRRAPRGRGATGLARAARRAQPGPQRRVGEPPARGERRRAPARRDRDARGRRAPGEPAARRPARRRRTPRDARGEPHRLGRAAELHRSAVQRALERIERLALDGEALARRRARAVRTATRPRAAALA